MNTKICTSIEQSEKLLSLGLDPSSADMKWKNENVDTFIHYTIPFILEDFEFCDLEKDIPCWSLEALLELMPIGSHIEKKKNCYACYAVYTKPLEYSTPIEAAFETVCWLIEHGYIKVNK